MIPSGFLCSDLWLALETPPQTGYWGGVSDAWLLSDSSCAKSFRGPSPA